MIWTADGRPHPAATRTLRFAAERTARKGNGLFSAAALLQRWKHEIAVELARRRAAMARSVMPRAGARQLWLLSGHTDDALHSDERRDLLAD